MEPGESASEPKAIESKGMGKLDFNRRLVDFIIPTYNNPQMVATCVRSLCYNTAHDWDNPFFHIWIVDNSDEKGKIEATLSPTRHWTVLHEDTNRGWEGALEDAYPFTEAPVVCFLNDDTILPPNDPHWLHKVLRILWERPEIGMVGPSSNFVMGYQNIQSFTSARLLYTTLLSGFCMFVRREALDAVGGISRNLEGGGDDIDLSIRMNLGGWKIAVTKDAYLHHHGSVTGDKLHKDWNGQDRGTRMKQQLARLYGFKNLLRCMRNDSVSADLPHD